MIARLVFAATLLTNASATGMARAQAIHFDLPATAAAIDVTPEAGSGAFRLVSIDFNLSLIVDTLPAPSVEQLLIQISPLGGDAIVADYCPRTSTASDYTTAIEVSHSKETTDHAGLSLDGAYGHSARANVGADHGRKRIDTEKYSRVAPLHIVASSGTTHRGRGVYFKLRADDTQILEGDRVFTVVLKVPSSWRGELVDVRIEAESITKGFSSVVSSLAGLKPKSGIVGRGRFLVAAHLHNDAEISAAAGALYQAESKMRELAYRSLQDSIDSKLSPMQHVSFRLDISAPDWIARPEKMASVLERVIFGAADPYTDRDIASLPVRVRVAILEYLDAEENFRARSKGLAANESVVAESDRDR